MNDLIIIGAGPAGLSASIYASCYHLKHLVIGKLIGGQLQYAPDIINYPGFQSISGKELTKLILSQVKKRWVTVVEQMATRIDPFLDPKTSKRGFTVETQDGQKYRAKAIILATGKEIRKLQIKGEAEYTGRGVHYCSTCEKQDYEGKVCAVVGGANSAVAAAVELAQAASKVYIIYRKDQLRGDPVWLTRVQKNETITVLYNSVVAEIVGDGAHVTGIKLAEGGKETRLRKNGILLIDKLFVEIGGVPGTSLVIPLGVEVDKGGYIKVNDRLETTVSGIFAAGDLVSYAISIEQISSAIGLGARASASAFAYLKDEKAPSLWEKHSSIRRWR